MAWKVFADHFETSDLTSAARFQSVTFGNDLILRAIRTWVVVYNNPSFTHLNMKIYSNEVISTVNTPKKLIATSTNVQTKAQIHTLENGVKEIWFEFDYPVYNGSDIYNIVINGTGYTYAEGSHLAWVKGYPNPVYSGGYTPALETLPYAPYELYFIGADL